jgi:hypothetical protein
MVYSTNIKASDKFNRRKKIRFFLIQEEEK